MELVIDARSGGMTDGYHVVLINLVVAIHILILHITRNHGREGLSRRVGNICLILEETNGLQAIKLTKLVACLYEVGVCTRLLRHLLNLVLAVEPVATHIEGDATQGFSVIQAYLQAFLIHYTCIDIRCSESYERRVSSVTRYPNVGAMVIESFHGQVQAIEEASLYAHIIHIGFLVVWIGCCQSTDTATRS